jgi:hypothetical protein
MATNWNDHNTNIYQKICVYYSYYPRIMTIVLLFITKYEYTVHYGYSTRSITIVFLSRYMTILWLLLEKYGHSMFIKIYCMTILWPLLKKYDHIIIFIKKYDYAKAITRPVWPENYFHSYGYFWVLPLTPNMFCGFYRVVFFFFYLFLFLFN